MKVRHSKRRPFGAHNSKRIWIANQQSLPLEETEQQPLTLVTNAKRLSHKMRTVLRLDPSRTFTLRRALGARIKKAFARFRLKLHDLLVKEDALGLTGTVDQLPVTNQRWSLKNDPDKINAFKQWIKQELKSTITSKTEEQLWQSYINKGFEKGVYRGYDDISRPAQTRFDLTGKEDEAREHIAFRAGSKDQFVKGVLGRPTTVDRVQMLVSRSFTDLEGVTDEMSTRMTRHLTDGLVQGKGPREVAREMDKDLNLGRNRALTIARTNLVGVQAEGQLHAMEEMGVTEVGVAVEWSTADDGKVCSLCEPLEGVVFKVEEAHGLLPRHPNCRCAFMPANVGEDTEDQKRTQKQIERAVDASADGGNDEDDWPGALLEIDEDRPRSILNQVNYDPQLHEVNGHLMNAFCPTGPGGGIKNDCSPNQGGGADGSGESGGYRKSQGVKLSTRDEDLVDEIIGGKLSSGAWGAMATAPDSADVKVGIWKPSDSGLDVDAVSVTANAKGFQSHRLFYREGNELIAHNVIIEIDKGSESKGRGADLFKNQVDALRAHGVSELRCEAAGSGQELRMGRPDAKNGYYTWPRLGYDATLRPGIFSKLPAGLQKQMGSSRSVLDLYDLPGGKEAWKEKGAFLPDARFDLRDGSRSMKVLDKYLKERSSRAAK